MVAKHSSPLEFTEARQIVLKTGRDSLHRRPLEQVTLAEAHGRILAQPIHADRDYPSLQRSLRDGYAVRAEDVP